MSNFRQKRNNYFEQQLGETANLRQNKIVFAHIMILLEPTVNKTKEGKIKRVEYIDDDRKVQGSGG